MCLEYLTDQHSSRDGPRAELESVGSVERDVQRHRR